MAYNGGVTAKPFDPIWRGKFKIPARDIDIDLAACLYSTRSSIVGKVAKTVPDLLHLEIFARRDVWPACFKRVPPTEFSIHVLFFSEGRDEDRLDSLVNDAVSTDFALKAKMGEVELLIFTSCLLPERHQRHRGKFYFWGVFMGQSVAFSHKSDSDARGMLSLSLNSGDINPAKCMDGPMHIPNEYGALKKHPAGSKKRGRRLDDAWSHAKPLDELRQKTECKYCGFVSEYGGISRLKVHLSGKNPRLPGCDKVSIEIKTAMTEWYSEWVKNTKALWVKEFQRTSSPSNPRKRTADDDVWEHATRLNENGYNITCMYCGFVSNRGGIKQMKVHLAGGNPVKHLEGCPNAPPNVKTLMLEGINKKTKDTKIGTAEMELQDYKKTSDTQLTFKRSNILQETLEEVKNTSLKASLQKLIDKKKNAI